MGFLLENGYMNLCTVFLSIVICIVTYFKWSFKYWESRKMPYLNPRIPWGTLNNILLDKISFGEVTLRDYQMAKHEGHKFIGLFAFAKPMFMIIDPNLAKQIMSTDFKYFMNRGVFYNERDDPLSAHLFSIEGAKWRNLRVKLTPTFTTGKIKAMFHILTECGDQLKDAMDNISLKKEPVDIKDILARFTTNIIGSTAFGLECNTFADTDSAFRKYGKRIFALSFIEQMKSMLCFMNPDLGRRLRFRLLNKETTDFFMNVIKETVDYREKNNIERNDFMQLLIHLKNDVLVHTHDDDEQVYNHDGKCLTFDELAAQAFVFFVAGYETSSTTMTFCLFELSMNPDIQDKLRKEVQEVLLLHGGKLTYEAISDMKFMGQVIDETLRKYPPLPVLNRKCSEDYKIPDTNFVLEKGTAIFIPIVGFQNDPEYFPNPEKFEPERFNEENKHNIRPYTYLPFGEGPRICIGLRFGLLQTKVGLAVLLQNFKFSLNIKTKIPLKMDPASFIQSTYGDMWLNVEKV